MASRSINMYYCYCDGPLTCSAKRAAVFPLFSSSVVSVRDEPLKPCKRLISRALCSAAPESTTAAVADKKEASEVETKEAPPTKPKRAPPVKAPAKPLPQLMEEDVIPSLASILEAQEDLSQIELSYNDNRLEGSFQKNGIPHCFWAFFPSGVLTGPKGFSLSSYGSTPSTIEPFLIDEKKITGKHVVFWVEKRLAAQGILSLLKE